MVPDGWKVCQVGEIARVIRGASPRPKGDPRYYGGKVPRLMVSDVTRDGKYVTPKTDFLTEEGAKLSRPMPAGSLTVVCSGTVGVPSFLAVDACIHDGFLALDNISDTCDKEYLYYTFSRLQQDFDSAATHGGVFTNLTTEILRTFKIPLPTVPEQKKIAAILSSVDEAIASTQAVIDQTRKVKQRLLQQLLTRGIGHTRFKESAIGEIPVTWEVDELAKVARVIDCKHRTPEYIESGFPVVRPRDIKEGALDLSGCLQTTKEDYEDLIENHCPSVGDVIYSRNATFGVAAIVETNEPFTVGQDVCIIVGKILIGRLLFYLLNSRIIKLQIDKLSAGSTFQRINLKDIRRFLVPVIPEDEQKEIVTIADSITEEIKTSEAQLHHLYEIKRGLMQDLLTGKVRVGCIS